MAQAYVDYMRSIIMESQDEMKEVKSLYTTVRKAHTKEVRRRNNDKKHRSGRRKHRSYTYDRSGVQEIIVLE